MNLSRPLMIAVGLIATAALIGLWAYARLPADARIAVHFAANGAPNGFADKGVGLFLLPGIGLLAVLTVGLLPGISPRSEGLEASMPTYGVLLVGVGAVMLASEAAIVARTFDPTFDVLRAVFMAVGALLVGVGNMLPKLRHNYLIGIRTPWTLTDPRVWDKTHRFTGRLMFAAGLALMPIAALTPAHRLLTALMVACAAGPALAGAVYSWLIFPKAARGHGPGNPQGRP